MPLPEKEYASLRRNLWMLRKNVDSLDSDFTHYRHYVQRRIGRVYSALSGLEKVSEIGSIKELGAIKAAEDRFFPLIPIGWEDKARLAYRDIRPGLQLVLAKAGEISRKEKPAKDLSKKDALAAALESYVDERKGIHKHENDFPLPKAWYEVLFPMQMKVKGILADIGSIDPYLKYEDSFMEAEEYLMPVKGFDSSDEVKNAYKERRLRYNLTDSLEEIDKLLAIVQKDYGISDAELGISPKPKRQRKRSPLAAPAEKFAGEPEEAKCAEEQKPQEPFTKTVYVKIQPEMQKAEERLFDGIPKAENPSEYYARYTKMDVDSIDRIVGEIALKIVGDVKADKAKDGIVGLRGTGWDYEDLYGELRELLVSSQYSRNEKNLKIISEVDEVLANLPMNRDDISLLFDPMRVSLYHVRISTNRYRRRFERKAEMEKIRKDALAKGA
jgi:hypothetical protein